jgi:hypothetical protein
LTWSFGRITGGLRELLAVIDEGMQSDKVKALSNLLIVFFISSVLSEVGIT